MTDRTGGHDTDVDLDGDPADVVHAAWAEVLGLETIDHDVGFFDLGATSAMMVGVVRILRRRWPHLKVVNIFSHPTIAQLAAYLDDA